MKTIVRNFLTNTRVVTIATLLVALGIALIAMGPARAAGSGHVTYPEYHKVKVGWSRDRVQRLFGTTGRYRGLYATGKHIYLTKTYPTDTSDTRVKIVFIGPLTEHPHAGPFHVHTKQLVG